MLFSCKSTESDEQFLNKLDAASLNKLKQEESKSNQELIDLTILLNSDYSQEISETLEKNDVSVVFGSNKIVTAKASPISTRKILQLDFIKAIEINKSKKSN